jgi:DedD protein
MKWAFWKRKRSPRKSASAAAAGPEPDFDSGLSGDDADADEAAARALRVRSRRRLIGACALLLTAVVLVPMVLDPTPHAVPDTIPIDLPSDRTPFAPHLAAPAATPTADTPADAAAAPAAPGAAADAAADAAPGASPGPPGDANAAAKGKKHAAADGAKSEAHHRLFVQAAAMARESAARELAGRIAKSGLTPFVERTENGDVVRYRVRLGPYASRTEAEHARARLKALGVDANIVGT